MFYLYMHDVVLFAGLSTVLRGCYPIGVTYYDTCRDVYIVSSKDHVCICTTDLCNNAPSIQVSGLLLGYIATVVKFFL